MIKVPGGLSRVAGVTTDVRDQGVSRQSQDSNEMTQLSVCANKPSLWPGKRVEFQELSGAGRER